MEGRSMNAAMQSDNSGGQPPHHDKQELGGLSVVHRVSDYKLFSDELASLFVCSLKAGSTLCVFSQHKHNSDFK